MYIGPMFSGKTSALGRDIQRQKIAGRKCAIVKYAEDNRYDVLATNGGLVAHSLHEYHGADMVGARALGDVRERLAEYEVIGIDEIQFFPDAVACVNYLAESRLVICAGLDADYLGLPFSSIGALVASAENVHKLKAVCMSCGADASFTKRTTEETELVIVGGKDKYKAVCRKCR